METKGVRVRFPNESYYDILYDFKWGLFREEKIFDECVFGWYDNDIYICINRQDYDREKKRRGDDNF